MRLKEIKNRFIVALLVITAKALGFVRGNNAKKAGRALVAPPVPYAGSLGDQAMLKVAVGYLEEQGFQKIGVLTESSAEQWGLSSERVSIESIGIPRKLEFLDLTLWRFLAICYSYGECLITGADVLDGGHGDWGSHGLIKARLAANMGLATRVLGCSINESPSERARRDWLSLPTSVKVFARDPVSHQRLSKLTVQRPHAVADLAFQLKPTSSSAIVKECVEWQAGRKASGNLILGVNVSGSFLKEVNKKMKGGAKTDEEHLTTIADVLTRIASHRPNISLLFIPHDIRGERNDCALNERMSRKLLSVGKNNIYLLPKQIQADEVKAIVSECDLVLTARMHLAIASFGQSTPCVCLAYQGKFEGLLQEVGLSDSVITAEDFDKLTAEEISIKVVRSLDEREVSKQRLISKLPSILEKSKENFK